MKIAVDAMGGDHAPQVIVQAVEQAVQQYPNLTFVLFGDPVQIKSYQTHDSAQLEIVPTTEVIENEDEPVKAIRSKKDSSLVRAAQAVKKGEADALFSLGSTGALLAASIFIIGRIKGIDRPALMPTMPAVSATGLVNVLDVGANAESKPAYLEQWALLGTIYAQTIRKLSHPKIALLNNGTEFDKGDRLHQEVYQRLSHNTFINFIGNVESNHLLDSDADVIVTDGFTGNAALKAVEGMAKLLLHQIKEALLNNGTRVKVGALLAKPAFATLKSKFDPSLNGGAVLLGVKAPVIKAHGAADVASICSTIEQIDIMLTTKMIDQVVLALQHHVDEGED